MKKIDIVLQYFNHRTVMECKQCRFYSATDDFNHGVVLSSRPLRSNEVFQVRIDKMVDKWAGSIEIGVTTHNPAYLQLPSTMTNLRSGEMRWSSFCSLDNLLCRGY